LDSCAQKPTVYIVDDDSAVRKSLRWLIEALGVNVKTFPSASSFLEAYDGAGCGCLLLDVRMPEMNGLDLLREMKKRFIDIPVIVLTGYADVPTAVSALKNGAVEFLEKPFDDNVILERIRGALASDSRRRLKRGRLEVVGERLARLTRREHEVLGLVVEGLASKEIAARLSLSVKTVEAHRAKIMSKMEVVSVADLVRTVVSAQGHARRLG
jgi:two-component system, LuxR family, response regulator FixJ